MSLRVAVFTESFLPYLSGVTVSVDALVRGLGSLGHSVLLVAPRPADGSDPAATSSGPAPDYAWVPSYEVPHFAPALFRMPSPLPRTALTAVERFRPDIVHANSPFVSGLTARAAAKNAGAPLVFTHHTRFRDYGHYLGPIGPIASRVVDAYLAEFWKGCAAVVAPSADLGAEIQAGLPSRRRRPVVRTIPTGVDLRAIDALRPIDSRPRFGWPADAIVAASLGRLAPEKNVLTLLDAFAVAVREEPRLRLLLIGGGPAEDELRGRAEEPDLRGRVAFTGLLPHATALARLKRADLFAFASLTETQGIVLAEAQACGLPVVALHGPGVRATVTDGVDGVVVARGRTTPGDTADLAHALSALARDEPRRSAMRTAARSAAERFGLERCLAQVVELYREVLA